MKSLKVLILLTVFCLIIPSGLVKADSTVELPKNRVFLGVYDPNAHFDEFEMDVQAEFFAWAEIKKMDDFIKYSLANKRVPLVSLYADKTASGIPGKLLSDTFSGKNDEILKNLSTMFKAQGNQVIYIRIFYEMELFGLNPWSHGRPAELISAWKYIVNFIRNDGVTNVKWVWSPAGNSDAIRYYPGGAYVDVIGITILASDAWDKSADLKPRSFKTLFEQKYKPFMNYGKPIIIAEMGITRENPADRVIWLKEALKYLQTTEARFLIGIVYFNQVNPVNIYSGFISPDWSIPPDQFWKPAEMPARKTE